MIKVSPVHESLLNRLRDTLQAVTDGNFYLIDTELQDGETIPKLKDVSGADTTTEVPTVTLRMGDTHIHPRGRGLDGVRNALGILTFTVSCVASDGFKVSQLRDAVWESLIGWIPAVGCGEIDGDDGGYQPPVAGVLKPQIYMKELGFWSTVGA